MSWKLANLCRYLTPYTMCGCQTLIGQESGAGLVYNRFGEPGLVMWWT